MVNSRPIEKFKKGSIYEITSKNTHNETVFDSTAPGINDSRCFTDEKRYSVYGIKLTDSCMNGIKEFLKARTNDPAHCVSELEIHQKNFEPLTAVSHLCDKKISFSQHNLRDKQKTFHLRTMDDGSSFNAPAHGQTNEVSCLQDIIVGMKFRSDNKKILSIGSINQKLVVMGNNESFDITMKKLENQAQQREQSKAKYIKPATAKRATIASAIVTRRNSGQTIPLNGSRSSILNTIKPTPKTLPSRNSLNRVSQLSTMTIRNISKPSQSTSGTSTNDTRLRSGVRSVTANSEEYSLKDHVIFNLMISPLTIDELCDKVATNTRQTISKITIQHLIKSCTLCDAETKTYSLISRSNKTPAQLEKWKQFVQSKNLHHSSTNNNNDDKPNPRVPILDKKSHDCPPANTLNQLPQKNEPILNVQKRTMNQIAPAHINKNKCEIEMSKKAKNIEPITRTTTTNTKLPTKTTESNDNEKLFLDFDETLSVFADIFPAIKDANQYNNYVGLFEKIYPSYLEKKTKFDILTSKVKKLHQQLDKNPNDQTIRHQLTTEERILNDDVNFLNLYSDTKFLHCKLSHLKDMVNCFSDTSSSNDKS